MAADIAVAVVRSRIAVGRFVSTGPREFSTLFTYVAVRHPDSWRIRAGSSVAIADPQTGEFLTDGE